MTTKNGNETDATQAPSTSAAAPQENRRAGSSRPRRRVRARTCDSWPVRSCWKKQVRRAACARVCISPWPGVFCFIGWATITPLTETARAPGHVIPVGTVLGIQHFEGGIVSQVLVKDGTVVEKGDVIVRLHQTPAAAELEENRSRIAALSLQLERHRAFAEGRDPDYSEVDPKYKSLGRGQSGDPRARYRKPGSRARRDHAIRSTNAGRSSRFCRNRRSRSKSRSKSPKS